MPSKNTSGEIERAAKTAVDLYRVNHGSLSFIECFIKLITNLKDGDSIVVTREGEFYTLTGECKS